MGRDTAQASQERRRIRQAWKAAGQPPCRICEQPIHEGEKVYASAVWNAVVHRLCSAVVGASGAIAERCMQPDDFCRRPKFCPCPLASTVNLVIAAHVAGLVTVEAPTWDSPGAARAAVEAGFPEPPEWLPVDVPESVREGRIVAVRR